MLTSPLIWNCTKTSCPLFSLKISSKIIDIWNCRITTQQINLSSTLGIPKIMNHDGLTPQGYGCSTREQLGVRNEACRPLTKTFYLQVGFTKYWASLLLDNTLTICPITVWNVLLGPPILFHLQNENWTQRYHHL